MIDDDLETTGIFMQNTVKPFGLRFWYPFFFLVRWVRVAAVRGFNKM